MAKHLKKHGFSLPIERLFTDETVDAFDLIHFQECEPADGESAAAFEKPDNWSSESASMLAAAAACRSIPAYTRSIEENTVPSWLWRRVSEGCLRSGENSAKQIFHRAAGAAAYAGWKKGVFAEEAEARAFFDEIRYMLAQRFIAFEPRHLAAAGLDWAYGIEEKMPPAAPEKIGKTDIRNANIDALIGGDEAARHKWQKIIGEGAKSGFLEFSFADIAADWNGAAQGAWATRAALDLLAFRRDDGAVDIDRLRHAAKLVTIMLELQDSSGIAIGLHNLAPLLVSQALPYDSAAGRATAAALAAVVTAEACATSAQLAGLLGPSLDFAANREGVLRALRNHCRAAYGDRNDYEKISVLPAPLELDPGADLALIASARRRWNEALELVQQHGLRFTRFTDLTPGPALAYFMESLTHAAEPMPLLTTACATDADVYRRVVHPSILEALVRLGYDGNARQGIVAHISGAGSLAGAPGIDHAGLRRRGFDDAALEKIEHYLPYVNDIRLAFTPWILGEEFIRDILKIPAEEFEYPRFDLLRRLGFSAAAIDAANVFCYGAGTARGAKGLKPGHAAVFALAKDVSSAARIRMAAALQSFISGDARLSLTLTAGEAAAESERLLLEAWRQGIKSIAIEWSPPVGADTASTAHAELPERIPATPAPRSQQRFSAPLRSALGGRARASGQLVGIKGRNEKSAAAKKHRPRGNS